MNRSLAVLLMSATASLATNSLAGPREDLIATYAAAAKAASPTFTAFSAARGEALNRQTFSGGRPDTPSCTSCHASDPRSAGRSSVGKVIAPMAASLSSTRYTDPAKVEKWFRRNCTEVMGRECSTLEKGDWLAYMLSL